MESLKSQSKHLFKPGQLVWHRFNDEVITIQQLTIVNNQPCYYIKEFEGTFSQCDLRPMNYNGLEEIKRSWS